MSEYKLLKDFGELVPGMRFISDDGWDLNMLSVGFDKFVGRFIHYNLTGTTTFYNQTQSVGGFTHKYKLIHDPRPTQNIIHEKTIQEKISEHKFQIEILEKELEKESLKNVLEIGSVYRISDICDRSYICKVLSLNDLSFDYMTTEDNSTRLLRYVEVKKIFKICSLDDMFK